MESYCCTLALLPLLLYSLMIGKSTEFASALPCDPPCVNGVCVADHGQLSCSCDSNWSGKNCSVFICDEVDSVCENGGRCLPDPDNSTNFLCYCPLVLGDLCQYRPYADSCAGRDCSGQGNCYGINNDPGWVCRCNEGKFGPNCEFSGDDPCELVNQCHGHGSCSYTNLTAGEIRHNCTCDLGYSDEDDCQIHEQCSINRCQNGGTCSGNLTSYTCQCPPGYVGETCTEAFDVCDGACQNGGNCSVIANGHYYNCTCPTGYFSYRCGKTDLFTTTDSHLLTTDGPLGTDLLTTGSPESTTDHLPATDLFTTDGHTDGTLTTELPTPRISNFCSGENDPIILASGITAVFSLYLAASLCAVCTYLATKKMRPLQKTCSSPPEQILEDGVQKVLPHIPAKDPDEQLNEDALQDASLPFSQSCQILPLSPLSYQPPQASVADAQPYSPTPSPPTASYLQQLVGENLC